MQSRCSRVRCGPTFEERSRDAAATQTFDQLEIADRRRIERLDAQFAALIQPDSGGVERELRAAAVLGDEAIARDQRAVGERGWCWCVFGLQLYDTFDIAQAQDTLGGLRGLAPGQAWRRERKRKYGGGHFHDGSIIRPEAMNGG